MRVAKAVTSSSLRGEISALNATRSERYEHDATFGRVPHVVYRETGPGEHGNFLPASYKRISRNAAWSWRLEKTYTASSRVPRRYDRHRGELECANSSDALLMNIFCYPRVTHSPRMCALLGIDIGQRPEFGVRAHVPMQKNEVDRTECDMRLGNLLVEAKLTESSFGTAARHRVNRYLHFEEIFEMDELPWVGEKVGGYQLIRGVLAACASDARFVLVCDTRRCDLQDMWFRVLRAVRSCEVRSRMAVLSWQEIAACTPGVVQQFLRDKYGIVAA